MEGTVPNTKSGLLKNRQTTYERFGYVTTKNVDPMSGPRARFASAWIGTFVTVSDIALRPDDMRDVRVIIRRTAGIFCAG